MAENTLVIFASDHGCHFFSHLPTVAKCTGHESSIHIPMLVRGPGFAPGTVVDAPGSLVDLAPAMLQSSGQAADPEFPGLPLQHIAEGKGQRQTVRIELPGLTGLSFNQGAMSS